MKGSDEVTAINKNTLSVKIDGKAKEALVLVNGEVESPPKDDAKRGLLKIRQDLMRAPTPPPPSSPTALSSSQPSPSSPSPRSSSGNIRGHPPSKCFQTHTKLGIRQVEFSDKPRVSSPIV